MRLFLAGLFLGLVSGVLVAFVLADLLSSPPPPAYRYDGLFLAPHG